jgi:RimJ/RimL family protein N-acetyltransferase
MAERHNLTEEREKAVLRTILGKLEQALEYSTKGREAEAEAIAQELIESLNTEIRQDGRMREEGKRRPDFDRSKLPQKGEILGQNGRVVLRAIADEDHDNSMRVALEDPVMRSAIENEAIKKDLWERFLTETAAIFSIFDRRTGEYLGYCGIKDLAADPWELLMELSTPVRGKGYGYSALVLLLDSLVERTGEEVYRARIDANNYASQTITKKVGGSPDGISEMFMHGEELAQFQEENRNLIDDKLKQVAEEFGVNPIDLIGHFLEYRIVWHRRKP